MLKLSKKVEYAILAIQYLAENPGDKLNAKEIAQKLNLPYGFLSKTMQSLMKSGLVNSIQGVKGGYILSEPAENISLLDIVNATDEKIAIVDCILLSNDICERNDYCTIKSPMYKIQKIIEGIFANTTLSDLINNEKKYNYLNGYSIKIKEINKNL